MIKTEYGPNPKFKVIYEGGRYVQVVPAHKPTVKKYTRQNDIYTPGYPMRDNTPNLHVAGRGVYYY